jgi:hypothetical protein
VGGEFPRIWVTPHPGPTLCTPDRMEISAKVVHHIRKRNLWKRFGRAARPVRLLDLLDSLNCISPTQDATIRLGV